MSNSSLISSVWGTQTVGFAPDLAPNLHAPSVPLHPLSETSSCKELFSELSSFLYYLAKSSRMLVPAGRSSWSSLVCIPGSCRNSLTKYFSIESQATCPPVISFPKVPLEGEHLVNLEHLPRTVMCTRSQLLSNLSH